MSEILFVVMTVIYILAAILQAKQIGYKSAPHTMVLKMPSLHEHPYTCSFMRDDDAYVLDKLYLMAYALTVLVELLVLGFRIEPFATYIADLWFVVFVFGDAVLAIPIALLLLIPKELGVRRGRRRFLENRPGNSLLLRVQDIIAVRLPPEMDPDNARSPNGPHPFFLHDYFELIHEQLELLKKLGHDVSEVQERFRADQQELECQQRLLDLAHKDQLPDLDTIKEQCQATVAPILNDLQENLPNRLTEIYHEADTAEDTLQDIRQQLSAIDDRLELFYYCSPVWDMFHEGRDLRSDVITSALDLHREIDGYVVPPMFQ